MFIYWDGYEIDGSDTDFSLVLPENVQLSEFVDCFLSLPVFVRDQAPSISWYQDGKRNELSVTELHKKLLAGGYPTIEININCLLMEQMPAILQEKLYSISERREPPEKAYGKVESPCMAPLIQRDYTRGDMTVTLRIPAAGSQHVVTDSSFEPNGYVNNIELLRSSGVSLPYLDISVGPGFYYEYAIYIIDSLLDSFPSLATYGGLDCEGGWTDGCTYANSIYWYEKVQLPIEHNISHSLKHLTEYGIMRPCQHYYQWDRKIAYTTGFVLANHQEGESGKQCKQPTIADFKADELGVQPKHVSFTEYLHLVETAFLISDDPFTLVCDTAAYIMLLSPEEFSQNPSAMSRLQAAVPAIPSEFPNQDTTWLFTGFFSFTLADGKPACEFRVAYKMRPYLLILLELAESGEIEFMKQITYKRRKQG